MSRKPLILIVEDDDVTAECLSDLLSAEGYATQILDVPRTVDAVRRAQPDMVLLDLVFPDMRGEQMLQGLRGDRDLAGLPVLLLSAVPHLAERAAELPVQGYVAKPFDLDVLLRAVGDLVGGASLQCTRPDLQWAPA